MRSKIYKLYNHILDSDDEKFNLKQQTFLQHYVKDNYDNIDKLLLYHGIGTGKTRSSILIAEEIMKIHPKMETIVILPARLKTNYLDELIPIVCKSYKKELEIYNNIKTPDSELKKLRIFFATIISKKYAIISYEYITNLFKKSDNLKKLINFLTKDKIIIIDEFHNLIATKVDEKHIISTYKTNKMRKNTKNIRSLIMRILSRYADDTCKMFFLTATPIYDNYNQFLELVKLLNKEPIKDDDKDIKISSLIPYIKNKISYYTIDNKDDFPEVKIKREEIPLSKTQDKKTYEILFDIDNKEDDDDNNIETFLVKQRQVSISAYGYNDVNKVLSNLQEYAPKLKLLFNKIEEDNTGKHLIYSNFIIYCLYIIKTYLDKNGWVNYTDNYKIKPYKTYVLWDSSLNDNNKQNVKQILNDPNNIDGKHIKIILGSPSIKEGITFKHIQHLHQLDPVWNASAKEQIEGRCIRYKSHIDIPLDHPFLKRQVIIHNYISIPMKNNKNINRELITETCDQRIYDRIIPNKIKIVSKITKLLSKVAIDYYLYKKLSEIPEYKSSSSLNNIISNEEDDIYLLKKVHTVNIDPSNKNTCPKIRRPINNKCKEGYMMKLNKLNFKCCYKLRENKKETTNNNTKGICPKPRIPVNGICPLDGYEIRKNKYGKECCYKKKKV